MKAITEVKSLDEFNHYFRQRTLHPYVSVGDLSCAEYSLFSPTDFGMYCIILMDEDFGEVTRAGKVIHYKAGTVFCLKPGQVISTNLNPNVRPKGWMLAFRPELLIKTGLGRDFFMFSFFNYEVLDALTLSSDERRVILDCFSLIIRELHEPSDNISGHMLRLSISLLLSNCKRYFERTYVNLVSTKSEIRLKLDAIIDDYLSSGLPIQNGQPTVNWCAQQFNWSPNYFGDVIKREMHVTAQDYIQQKIIDAAKVLLNNPNLSISEIAETLGFTYPNHFARLFHKRENCTPTEYREAKKILRRS